MTDEISIQQQRPSMMPYVLTAGAVGGVGGATAAYQTSPKYKSAADIIAENTSKDQFKKVVEEEISDESARTKALSAYDTIKGAGEKYDADLEAYKKANQGGEAIIDEKLTKAEADAKKELETVKNKFVEAKKDELANRPARKLSQAEVKVNAAIDKEIQAIKTNAQKDTSAYMPYVREQGHATVEKGQSVLEAQIELANEQKKPLEDFMKALKEGKMPAHKPGETFEKNGLKYNLPTSFEFVDKEHVTHKVEIKKENLEYIKKNYSEINKQCMKNYLDEIENNIFNELKNHDGLKDVLKDVKNLKQAEQIADQVKAAREYYTTHLNADEMVQKLVEAAKAPDVSNIEKQIRFNQKNVKKLESEVAEIQKWINVENYDKLADLKEADLTTNQKDELKALKEKIKGYSAEDLKTARQKYKTMTLSNLLENNNNEIKAKNDFIKNNEKVVNDAKELAKKADEIAAQIKAKGGQITKDSSGKIKLVSGKPVITQFDKATRTHKPFDMTKLEYQFEVPLKSKDAQLIKDLEARKATSKLTPEQIEAEVEKLVANNAEIKGKQTAFDNARKAVEEAKANAKKTPTKTVEELTKEFVEKNGSREDAIKKATESCKDDLSKFFEKSLKMNGKTAALVAGGIAIGGLIGSMIAPKKPTLEVDATRV